MLKWSDIPGWFTWPEVYDAAVDRTSDGGLFVALGTFCGRSACYMAEKIQVSGKKIIFETIDNFSRSFGLTVAAPLAFIEQAGFKDAIVLREMHQLEAVGLYADKSIDFLFIDSDHSYQAMKDCINAYLPKMKSGGVLAGDDYSNKRFPGVVQAVDEVLPGRTLIGSTFSYIVP